MKTFLKTIGITALLWVAFAQYKVSSYNQEADKKNSILKQIELTTDWNIENNDLVTYFVVKNGSDANIKSLLISCSLLDSDDNPIGKREVTLETYIGRYTESELGLVHLGITSPQVETIICIVSDFTKQF